MRKTLIIMMIAALIFSMMAGATLNSLVMKAGKEQATQLISNVPGYGSIATVYNGLQGDPSEMLKDAALQAVMANLPPESKKLFDAYQAITKPENFIESKIIESIQKENPELYEAYNTGLQLKSAVQDPANAAKQFALGELAKQDPTIGGKIAQAYMIKGYIDELMAEPGKDAATESEKEPPRQAAPTGPTAKAVAEPSGAFGDLTNKEAIIGSCAIGFSISEASSIPGIGDIQSCEIKATSAKISFAFNQEGVDAGVTGKGCTLSKTGTRIYIYNSDSCAIAVQTKTDKWAVPASGAGTYILFDKIEENIQMTEGRFIPAGDRQTFNFEGRGYEVPKGGVLKYEDGEFDMDLSGAQTAEFSLFTYKEGQLAGTTKVKQLEKERLKIRKTTLGFEVEGNAEIKNQFNRIISKGKITIDHRGILSNVGEHSDVLVYPTSLNLKERKELKSVAAPQETVRLRTKDDKIEFNPTCGKTRPKEPTVNICMRKGMLRIEAENTDASVSHIMSYAAKEDTTMSQIIEEVPQFNRFGKGMKERIAGTICNYNKALEDCGKIEKGTEVYIETALIGPKGKTRRAVEIRETLDALEFEGGGDVTSLGRTLRVDTKTGILTMPAMQLTAGFPKKQNEQEKIYNAIKNLRSYKTLEEAAKLLELPAETPEDKTIRMEALHIVAGDMDKLTERQKQIAEKLLKDELEALEEAERILEGPPPTTEIGRKAAEDVTAPLEHLKGPLISVNTDELSYNYDPKTGEAKVCGCRRGAEAGESASPTGMAAGESCTADSCSVTIEAPDIPEPKITTHGSLSFPVLGKPQLRINGIAAHFRGNTFQALVKNTPIGDAIYHIDKTGLVYLGGEFNPVELGEPILFFELSKKQMEYINAMCEADAACSGQWLSKEPEAGIEKAKAELMGPGNRKLLIYHFAGSEPGIEEKLTGHADEELTREEWSKILDACCQAFSEPPASCGCPT